MRLRLDGLALKVLSSVGSNALHTSCSVSAPSGKDRMTSCSSSAARPVVLVSMSSMSRPRSILQSLLASLVANPELSIESARSIASGASDARHASSASNVSTPASASRPFRARRSGQIAAQTATRGPTDRSRRRRMRGLQAETASARPTCRGAARPRGPREAMPTDTRAPSRIARRAGDVVPEGLEVSMSRRASEASAAARVSEACGAVGDRPLIPLRSARARTAPCTAQQIL